MMKGISDSPFFIQIRFELPVITDQIVDGVVYRQPDGDTGN